METFASSSGPVALFPVVVEKRFRGGQQRRLIAFDANDKLAFLVDNLGSNRFLTTHRINGNGRSFNVDLVQPFRDLIRAGIAVISFDFSSVATCPREM